MAQLLIAALRITNGSKYLFIIAVTDRFSLHRKYKNYELRIKDFKTFIWR
jgi:hypothetical protein